MLQSPKDLIEGKVYYFAQQDSNFIFEILRSRAGTYQGNLPQADMYRFEAYPTPTVRDLLISGVELQQLIDDGLISEVN